MKIGREIAVITPVCGGGDITDMSDKRVVVNRAYLTDVWQC